MVALQQFIFDSSRACPLFNEGDRRQVVVVDEVGLHRARLKCTLGRRLCRERGTVRTQPGHLFHAGLGGTFSLGDPVADISVSYTPNRLGELFERDPRRRGLVAAVYDCLGG
jgi:hypothetical protein